MAMKNINKFKQWTGEKLGREAKTAATEEFKELEVEMAMRQEGLEKLYTAAGLYIRAMGKKKEGEDKEKSLPTEIFGQAMISHGGVYAPESAYGQALLKLGAGMERISRLQEAYVHKASELALDTMERGLVQMKDYQTARRKLESRRLTYDSVLSKVQKMKKEDAKTEEELRSAKAKYEETSEDVHNRMTAIQEAEVDKLLDLTELMEAQLEYFKKCTDLLNSIKATWPSMSKSARSRGRAMPHHAHAYNGEDPPTVPSPIQPEPVPRPVITTKFKSVAPTTASSRSSPTRPTPSHLRRTQTDTAAVLLPRPSSSGNRPRKVMRVDHAFEAESDSEMSITVGELVVVLEEIDAGWYLGEIQGDETRTGMFPATYCTVLESPPVMPRRPPKPASPTRSESDAFGEVDEQVASLSLRRPAVRPPVSPRTISSATTMPIGRSDSLKKKPPPPPVSRGSKPVVSAGNTTISTTATVTGGTGAKCRECGCEEFSANVFKKGSCNNCFHVHIL